MNLMKSNMKKEWSVEYRTQIPRILIVSSTTELLLLFFILKTYKSDVIITVFQNCDLELFL